MQIWVGGAAACSNETFICSTISDCATKAEPLIFYNNPGRLPNDTSDSNLLTSYYEANRISTATLQQSTIVSTQAGMASVSQTTALASTLEPATSARSPIATLSPPSTSATTLPHAASGVGIRTGIGVGVGITVFVLATFAALFLARHARTGTKRKPHSVETGTKTSTDCDVQTMNSQQSSSVPFSPMSFDTLWREELSMSAGPHELDSVKDVQELDDTTIAELPA